MHKVLLSLFFVSFLSAQTFTRIMDLSNPIVSIQTANNYSGTAWIDYNNDGLLDLFATESYLFKNLGDGSFEYVESGIGSLQNPNFSEGVSWADFDNDGDLDCFISGNPSILYRNDGNDQFFPMTEGDLAADAPNRGWASAWADYDNNGYVDLFITHPAGFLGPVQNSHFFENNGNGTMTKNNNYQFSQISAPYTVGTWSDYDIDGDMDLFIGSGPASGTPAVDYLYQNMLIETETAGLVRIETDPIATDLQDGQVWNWIDYDNDGDLDAYLTNYGGAPNRFYKNNDGSFVSVSNNLTHDGSFLANTWGDVDNDGDLDVILTGDSGNDFFLNNGDDSFTRINNEISSLFSIGATLGDYDNDGDLDLFLSDGNQANNEKALFRNDTENDNHWLIISLKGTVSNNAAIGAKVRVKSNIDDVDVWQFREISAQNSFNSHNSLRAHFGLGNAAKIDSLQIIWPSGEILEEVNLDVNQIITREETVPNDFFRANISADKRYIFGSTATVHFTDLTITGESNPATSWQWDFNNDDQIDATIQNPTWTYDDPGQYSVKVIISDGTNSEEKLYTNYINLKRTPGIPIIESAYPSFMDTTIAKRQYIYFSASGYDTSAYEISYNWSLNGSIQSIDSVYDYRASSFGIPKVDTVSLVLSNGYHEASRNWIVNIVSEITAIEDALSIQPKNYALEQNFPNPFNPGTTIKYQLPQKAHVNISIFNITGQKIRELKNGFESQGYKEVYWNGLNSFGRPISTGIYFYSITVTVNSNVAFSSTQKMLLVK